MQKNGLNILYHHRTQGRGAEGVHITSIVSALESLGHKVTILSPPGVEPLLNAGNAPVDKASVNTSGINSLWKIISKYFPNVFFEFIEIIYNIPASLRLEKELSRQKYDLIYERYAFYMIVGSLKATKYNIPFILEANEVSGIKDRARKQTMKWLCRIFEKKLFDNCTSIFTVSSYLKNMILEHNSKYNVQVCPNAVDTNKFTHIYNNTDLINKYNLSDKIVIGFAGWFDNWDRLDLLLNTFVDLKTRYNNLVLILVGDGDVLNDIRTKIKEDGIQDVILTGAVERKDVHKYISLLDIAVITHSNEFGSPVVMFEFMGLKIPIVAPTLLPITDVLTNKSTACLFDPLDMEMMKSHLIYLLDNEKARKDISNKAYDKLITEHTWDKNANDIVLHSGLR